MKRKANTHKQSLISVDLGKVKGIFDRFYGLRFDSDHSSYHDHFNRSVKHRPSAEKVVTKRVQFLNAPTREKNHEAFLTHAVIV